MAKIKAVLQVNKKMDQFYDVINALIKRYTLRLSPDVSWFMMSVEVITIQDNNIINIIIIIIIYWKHTWNPYFLGG